MPAVPAYAIVLSREAIQANIARFSAHLSGRLGESAGLSIELRGDAGSPGSLIIVVQLAAREQAAADTAGLTRAQASARCCAASCDWLSPSVPASRLDRLCRSERAGTVDILPPNICTSKMIGCFEQAVDAHSRSAVRR